MNNIQIPLKKMANKISAIYSSLIKTERKDLVWENSNPTSAFDGQTISINLSAYERVGIEFFPYAWTSQYDIVSCETIPVGKKGYLHANLGSSGTTSGNFYAFRRDIEVTSSGVVFSDVYASNSGGAWSVYANKTGCVPYRIYGIKTVVGGNASLLNGNLGGPVIANYSSSQLNDKQLRNITISTSEPTSDDGDDGDIWIKYEV